MKTENIDLYSYFGIEKPENGEGVLTTYVIQPWEDFSKDRVRPAMLVLGGGGYAFVSNREKEPIALEFLSKGYCAFALEYSVAPIAYPYQLLEACMAMAYIRENAEELHVNKDMIGAIGFSAGGHLCGMLATMWNDEEVRKIFKDKVDECRPDAVILCYPVISSDLSVAHRGSINNISGGDVSKYDRFSLDKRVDKNSSPAFIWSTVGDFTVPCENSLLMAQAYKKADVPFELHIFQNGRHGLSLATEEVNSEEIPVQQWVPLCLTWLKVRGFKIQN